ESEVRTHAPDDEDGREDERLGVDDVAEEADHQPEDENGDQGVKGGLLRGDEEDHGHRTLYLRDAPCCGSLRRGARPDTLIPMPETATSPESVADVATGLREVGYLPGESTALVSYLATKLGKPVLVEGPAGVGKTELAKALSRYLDRTLVRLQ